ncbi:MAG TPA: PA14 domain-containing protein, partial [Vicinamibacterales bacterium]|nr:PA14 domain-containing protein [Vicinamibacterales bacterium]
MRLLRASLAAATIAAALFSAAAVLDPLREGLIATYFSDTAWASTPVRSRVERQPSTEGIDDAWSGAPPASFSVTWTGSLFVARSGTYTIASKSDDGSLVYVDGALVVDNGGGHRARLVTGTVRLDRGVHSIFVKYFQEAGAFEFGLQWARDGGTLRPIPAWALSIRQMEFARTLASVVLRRAVVPLVVLWAVLLAATTVVEWDRAVGALAALGARPVRTSIVALVVFAMLAVVHTWPLASDPAHLSRNDNGDAVLNTWTIAWVAHELPRDPRHLFDANIFYPEKLTLAYSEVMIVQSVMAMPLLALGASPVLAYNLVLIAGFALTAWAFFLLLWRWTHSWAAALVAGSLAGFNSQGLTQLTHLQFVHLEFVALVLFALDRLLTSERVRDAIVLGVGFALQGLTSVYLMVFTIWLILFGVLARAGSWVRERPGRTIGLLTLA